MNNGSLEPGNYICRVVSLKSSCGMDGSQMISHATIYSKSEVCGGKGSVWNVFLFSVGALYFLQVCKGSQKYISCWLRIVELLMVCYSKLAKLHLDVLVAQGDCESYNRTL